MQHGAVGGRGQDSSDSSDSSDIARAIRCLTMWLEWLETKKLFSLRIAPRFVEEKMWVSQCHWISCFPIESGKAMNRWKTVEKPSRVYGVHCSLCTASHKAESNFYEFNNLIYHVPQVRQVQQVQQIASVQSVHSVHSVHSVQLSLPKYHNVSRSADKLLVWGGAASVALCSVWEFMHTFNEL